MRDFHALADTASLSVLQVNLMFLNSLDIIYISDNPAQILSLMKFRHEHSADFKFMDLKENEFILSMPTAFSLTGQSVNDYEHSDVRSSKRNERQFKPRN